MPQNQARQAAQKDGDSILQNAHKIIFVSGKGGVGKSLVAAGIAAERTKAGLRCLLVEIGDKSYYEDFFSLPKVTHEPVTTGLGFDVALWSGESCLRDYVLYYLRLERLYHIFFENRVMRTLINVAPGLNEIAILGKITSGIRKIGPPLNYDLLVVDSYATGHALSLLQAPRGMMRAIGIGPMAQQSREIDAILRDPDKCQNVVVTICEEMPVVETIEFAEKLNQEFAVAPKIVANKIMFMPVSRADLESVARSEANGLGPFADYLRKVGDRQSEFLSILKSKAKDLIEIPLIFSNDARVLTEKMGEALRQV